MITYERIKELFDYDHETGIMTRNISVNNKSTKGCIVGTVGHNGYLRLMVDYITAPLHVYVWLWCYGYIPENEIDHIDRNRVNNRIDNLRVVSRVCQMRNRGMNNNNTSGVKGVSFCKQTGKWKAGVAINGRTKTLGRFNDFSDAVCARLAGEQCLEWEGCDDNSPALKYVKEIILNSE